MDQVHMDEEEAVEVAEEAELSIQIKMVPVTQGGSQGEAVLSAYLVMGEPMQPVQIVQVVQLLMETHPQPLPMARELQEPQVVAALAKDPVAMVLLAVLKFRLP